MLRSSEGERGSSSGWVDNLGQCFLLRIACLLNDFRVGTEVLVACLHLTNGFGLVHWVLWGFLDGFLLVTPVQGKIAVSARTLGYLHSTEAALL